MMNLSMSDACAIGLKSKSQMVRRITEEWAMGNLYCTSCDSNTVQTTRHNTQAIDFICPDCSAAFQLKAGLAWNDRRIPDAGYLAMMRALASDSVPNLLVMQYTPEWHVRNLMIVPSFFFTAAAVEKRKPLGPTARRAGWIGCNILLSEIAEIGKIRLVSNGEVTDALTVRRQYAAIRPLAKLGVGLRGWTLDVLRLLKKMEQRRFTTADAYHLVPELSQLHPNNRNVKPKIRQQLQVLRDLGFVRFIGYGEYELLR